ncbi:MAG: hypothetical protein GY953_40910, partial [bacterium]|nr:hypothetical protein [bacterium]
MSRIALFFLSLVLAAQQPAGLAPAPGGANLPAQPVGANDLIAVSVYDSPELTRTVRVSADGLIRLPMLTSRIRAKGLLPSELEIEISNLLREEQILVDPVVTVTIVEYHSRPISVAGAVNKPITFQAYTEVSLLDAVTRAGGLHRDAGPEILVSRSQPGPDGRPLSLVQRIPVTELIDSADPEWNIKLYGGEEIRVPEVGRVFVVGNITKPGAYPVDDAAGTSVLKILALSEGLAPYATKEAYIYRQEASGSKNEIEIPLRKIM